MIAFVALCVFVEVPLVLFVGFQSFFLHRRASRIEQLQPGTSQEQVTEAIGRPTSKSNDGSTWYYRAALPVLFRLPLLAPDDYYVEFSPEGGLSYRGVVAD